MLASSLPVSSFFEEELFLKKAMKEFFTDFSLQIDDSSGDEPSAVVRAFALARLTRKCSEDELLSQFRESCRMKWSTAFRNGRSQSVGTL